MSTYKNAVVEGWMMALTLRLSLALPIRSAKTYTYIPILELDGGLTTSNELDIYEGIQWLNQRQETQVKSQQPTSDFEQDLSNRCRTRLPY